MHPYMDSRWHRGVWGLVFVVAGAWWLLGELGIAPFDWSYFGPVVLIAVGVTMFFRPGRLDCEAK